MVLGHVVVNLEFFSGVERTRNEEKTLQRAAKGNNENEIGKGKREERQQNFDFVRNSRIDSREIKKRKNVNLTCRVIINTSSIANFNRSLLCQPRFARIVPRIY